jgi:hypothetical protein
VPPTTGAPIDAGAPQVLAAGRQGSCTFGNDCLIVDFTIVDFDQPQTEFVCEFSDGSRHTFRFVGAGAEHACVSSSADGTIVVEVGGVRSAVVTR